MTKHCLFKAEADLQKSISEWNIRLFVDPLKVRRYSSEGRGPQRARGQTEGGDTNKSSFSIVFSDNQRSTAVTLLDE